jgi:hypothetical protein
VTPADRLGRDRGARPGDAWLHDKVQVLLVRRDGAQELGAVIADEAHRALARLDDPAGCFARVLLHHDPDPFAAQFTDGRRAYDAVLELGRPAGCGDPLDLAAALASAGERLDGACDVERSTVAVGELRTVSPGTGAMQYLFCIRRRDGMTVEEFSEYWWTVHSQHAASPKLPTHRSYRQFHLDGGRSAVAASLLGVPPSRFDGVAEVHVERPDDVRLGSSTPEGARAEVDNARFIDRTTELGFLTRIELRVGTDL